VVGFISFQQTEKLISPGLAGFYSTSYHHSGKPHT